MPKATIWIRKEDLERWTSIKNKPEWIHLALNPNPVTAFALRKPKKGEVVLRTGALCKHYQVKGFCLVKGCKESKYGY